jgi:hypothetical protein
MERAHWHTFQVLKKRSSLMWDFLQRRYGTSRGPDDPVDAVKVEPADRADQGFDGQEPDAGRRLAQMTRWSARTGTRSRS